MRTPLGFLAIALVICRLASAAPPSSFPAHATVLDIASIAPQSSSNSSIVSVQALRGIKRVTLESFDPTQGWTLRAVAHLDGGGGSVNFRVPKGFSKSALRALGYVDDSGADPTGGVTTNFAKLTTSQPSNAGTSIAAPGNVVSTAVGSLASNASVTSSLTVSEADIWKIRGNTLYFFNQLRGLQILDISNPDAPVRRATLHLPAVGEDLYALDDRHLVLLTRNGSRWDQSEVILVTVTNAVPAITARFDVNGYIDTSRLVGTALYVATSAYANNVWGTQLSSFDFANVTAPIARGTLFFSGWTGAVAATDRYIFVATQDTWPQSTIQIVDIAAANGTMLSRGSVQAAGYVADKFKMSENGGVFTVISQVWQWWNAGGNYSKLETFSLTKPNAPAKLGELTFGGSEQLYATRIEGNRAYVVTAQQVDPLSIIDFSNPANPVIAGSVDVPGYSSFIQLLGDRLVTIGIVNHRISVSLFDVHAPAKPALLSRVAIGGTYSWSEALWDENAFTVLPDAGWILVPVNGWDPQTGEASQVQIIDLRPDALLARGVIAQRFGPRRATRFGSRILSISNRELLTVNAADESHPVVTSDVALAWPVDRVFLRHDFLVEVENGNSWDGSTPTLIVGLASDPDLVRSETPLTGLPIVGATVRDDKLYIAQADSQLVGVIPLAAASPNLAGTATNNASTLTVSIYDLRQLPGLRLLGSTQKQIDPLGWNVSLTALWPKRNVLVWAGNARGFLPIFWGGPIAVNAISPAGASLNVGSGSAVANGTSATTLGMSASTKPSVTAGTTLAVAPPATTVPNVAPAWWWFGGGAQGRLLAFEVGNSEAPAFLSDTKYATNAWNIGDAFAAPGAIYASHAGAINLDDPNTGDWGWVQPAVASPILRGWAQGWFLDVIDFSDGTAPAARDPVSIPTALIGIAKADHQGATLFTLGSHINDPTAAGESLDASVYDGVAVTLLDSVALGGWSNPAIVDDENVFVGQSTASGSGVIGTFTLTRQGKLRKLGGAALGSAPFGLRAFGDLLAAQISGQVVLFDKSDRASLQQIGASASDAFFYSLNLDDAQGDVTRGLWAPLGDYGVEIIRVNP